MNDVKFVRAEGGQDNSVVYYDAEGNRLIRYWKSFEGQPLEEASTRSWRNNNPGNLVMSQFSRKNGAIGEAGHVPNPKNKESGKNKCCNLDERDCRDVADRDDSIASLRTRSDLRQIGNRSQIKL